MNQRSSGSRRHRGDRNRHSSRPRSGDTFHVQREPRKPASFWDKIKAFFGFTPPPAAKPQTNGRPRRDASEARAPRESTSERAPRTPREPREPRTPRTPRKPEAVEVTTPRLYVGNLSYDAAESDIHELFSGVGTVAHVEIVVNKHTQRSKGFGFVQMNAISEAKRAVDDLHDKEYMGRKLVVSGAKLPADRVIGRDRSEATATEAPVEAAEPVPQQA